MFVSMDCLVFFHHKLLEQVTKVLMAIDRMMIVLKGLDYFFKELLHRNYLHFYLESTASVAVY